MSRALWPFLLLLVLGWAAHSQETRSYDELLTEAEALHERGSYEKALELYERAAALAEGDEATRWVAFRRADCDWRSTTASRNADASRLDAARKVLAGLADPATEPDARDRVWAEASESLADSSWQPRMVMDWGSAGARYTGALDWWAGRSDLELARRRYLDIVWKIVDPPENPYGHGWNGYVSYPGVQVLENAVRIAVDLQDRARAHWYLGLFHFQQGRSVRAVERAREELEAVVALGKATERYDDALFHLARSYEEAGEEITDEQGNRVWRPQFPEALALYRRLTSELRKGETPWYDDAVRRIRNIVEPSLNLYVERFFLPGSELAYRLQWRNLGRVDLSLYPADLTEDVQLGSREPDEWLSAIPVELLEEQASWRHETGDTGDHEPGDAVLTIDAKVPPGAYVLVARGGKVEGRALVLVGDAALTTKTAGRDLLAWYTDVQDGRPIEGAKVHLWLRFHDSRDWRRRELRGETDADGLCRFELPAEARSSEYFLAARKEGRQAFVQYSTWSGSRAQDEWRLYAYTDRSVYRPAETVSWKLLARRFQGSTYTTPAGAELRWQVRDPMGSTAAEGTLTLNAFGAGWAELETTAVMPLGEYTVQFQVVGDGSSRHLGGATLFRLEEFKAPEFEVAVETPDDPEQEGRKLLHRLGEPVSFEIGADYLFGAPVAGARVEVFVFQRPYYRVQRRPHEYPWLYQDESRVQWWGGPGQQVHHEVLSTDDEGRAKVTFDTPRDAGSDFEYTIEARVVDASRREIVGQGTVRVTRQAYAVDLEPRHAIHRPGAAVEVDVRAADANDQPVTTTGEVVVTREWWVEVWRDPRGDAVQGDALEQLKRDLPVFPPPEPGWRIAHRGYESEEVLRTRITTDAEGKGRVAFTPERDGTFKVAWTSKDPWDQDVRSETRVFVADERTRELGYLPGGIELLVDRDTFAVGDEASVVLVAPSSGRWVLFTVESDALHHAEVVHLEGTARFLKVPVLEKHVPNVWLAATSVYDGRPWTDVEEVVVPPLERFLEVEARFAEDTFLPGAEGELELLVRDHEGNPVRAELGVAVVDDSLAYIQGDYAGDPRQFFHGQRRPLLVQLFGTFSHNSWVRLVRDEKGGLRQARDDGAGEKEEGQFAQEEFRSLEMKDELDSGSSSLLGRQAGRSAPMAKAVASQRAANEPGVAPEEQAAGVSGGAPGTVEVRVRSDFRKTALWLPDVVTDDEGRATVRVSFPDSTTRWRTVARGADTGSRVGIGETKVRTRQPLIARLQTPRFFQTGDELVVSGNVSNQTEEDLEVAASLSVAGLVLLVDGRPAEADTRQMTVPAGDQVRLDWKVRAEVEGEAVLELAVLGQELGDAVRLTLPVHPHGIESLVALSGKFDDERLELSLDVPAARRVESTEMLVQVTPSLAVTMLDALPYLIDYPYGCTEQTLSRFVPTAIVAGTLKDLGLRPEDVLGKVFGGIEREHVDRTQPKGARDLARLDEMTKQGLERLYDFQHADGGWGWWKHGDSDRFMTAYVVWGLSLGRRAGIEVRAGVLERAARWLAGELVEAEDRLDEQAWMLHALAVHGQVPGAPEVDRFSAAAFDNLWKRRSGLNAYGRALLTLTAVETGRSREAGILAENLANGVQRDATPDTSILTGGDSRPFVQETAHWGADGLWRRWSEGPVETTAFCLRALLAVDPRHELVAPTVQWLVKNRRGAQWSNTRDTAIAVLALDDYLVKSGELESDVAFEVLVNGRQVLARELSGADLLAGPSEVRIAPEDVLGGANRIEIRRTRGTAPLYFAARASFFSLEEGIPARGSELFARRDYYALVGRPTLLLGTVYDRVLLKDGDQVESGQRIEVVLTFESKNELEYIVLEDAKPAGFEAVRVRSGEPTSARELRSDRVGQRFGGEDGEPRDERKTRGAHLEPSGSEPGYTGRTRYVHQELRDRLVSAFLDRLPQGTWELRYDLRAETPGSFHALPLQAHAMYVPEIRANGEELRVEVLDAP